jgi:hypothetical protein
MAPLGALPDCCEARLAVARAGAEATARGHVPPHLAERGRSLRWGAVRRHGRHGMPLPGCTHHVAGRLGRGATSPGERGDPPGHQARARHGGQPPRRRRHASRRTLTAWREHPAHEGDGPPTPRPRPHHTGPRDIRHGPARAHAPCHRRRAARWSARLGLARHALDGGPPASRPADALAWPPLDRSPAGARTRRPGGRTRARAGQTAGRTCLRPVLPHVTRRWPGGETPMAWRADAACRPFSRHTRSRLEPPLVQIPGPLRHAHDARLWTARLDLAGPLRPCQPPVTLVGCQGVAVARRGHRRRRPRPQLPPQAPPVQARRGQGHGGRAPIRRTDLARHGPPPLLRRGGTGIQTRRVWHAPDHGLGPKPRPRGGWRS